MAPRSLHRPPAGPSRTGRGCMAAPQGRDSGPGPSEPTGTSRTRRTRQNLSHHCPHQPGRPPPPPEGPSPPSPPRCACLKGFFFFWVSDKEQAPQQENVQRLHVLLLPAAFLHMLPASCKKKKYIYAGLVVSCQRFHIRNICKGRVEVVLKEIK